MIYLKYTDRDDPNVWTIYAHEKGDKKEKFILNSNGDTYACTMPFNFKVLKLIYNIKYLSEKEVDLLKLELL